MSKDETLDGLLGTDAFRELLGHGLVTTSGGWVINPPNIDKEVFQHPEETAAYYVCIAQIANSWSVFERILDGIIWDMAQVSPEVGSCLTSQSQSIVSRFKAIIALHIHRSGSAELLNLIRKSQSACQKVSNRRNRAVHDPIAYDHAEKSMVMDRLDADQSLQRRTEKVELSYFTETQSMIGVSITALIELGKRLRLEHFPHVAPPPSTTITLKWHNLDI